MARSVISSRRGGIVRLLIASALLVAFGSYFFYLGWETFIDGEVLIKRKNSNPYMAYAYGENSEAFFRYFRDWFWATGLIVLTGVALPICLVLLPSKQRNYWLHFFGETAGGIRSNLPWALALLICMALFGLLADEVSDRGLPPTRRIKPLNPSIDRPSSSVLPTLPGAAQVQR
ncbi:hypothetical protein [Polaromonas aquatica]|uniref:hypothetical protein n=1 Tax=Polaromonas aquatica TaxID=332657 RepID=UPI003D659AC7